MTNDSSNSNPMHLDTPEPHKRLLDNRPMLYNVRVLRRRTNSGREWRGLDSNEVQLVLEALQVGEGHVFAMFASDVLRNLLPLCSIEPEVSSLYRVAIERTE